MDESSQKKKGFDALVTAINMGAGIAAAVIAANKSKEASTEQGGLKRASAN
jgi:phosphoribosylcarboxyaminoimidazole (NCAIR) mutase